MKSGKFPILAGIAVAIASVALVLLFDSVQHARTAKTLQSSLNALSLPLLERGDLSPLLDTLEQGAQPSSPDLSFISAYLPLIELEPWAGEIQDDSLLVSGSPSAVMTSKAHYAKGSADLRAVAVLSGGQWRIRQFEVIAGPPAL